MNPLLEGAEILSAVGVLDHDLAVEHVAPGRERDLGEVAGQVTAVARLQLHLVAVDERDRAKAVVLGLIDPLLAHRKLRA